MTSCVLNIDEMPKDELLQALLKQIEIESWFGEMSREEAEKLLNGKKVGTYFFRYDTLTNLCILSGMNAHGKYEHSKIHRRGDMWLGIQGGSYIREDVKKLIPLCLHCEPEECVILS